MGNLKDAKLEKLADKGNGRYAYVDDLREAQKVFVDEMSGTLVTIAKDVKLQVKFNPLRVESYRLIGYENRGLAPQDFADDKKDAGEIGAGHSVTALYEIVPTTPAKMQEKLSYKFQYPTVQLSDGSPEARELLNVELRYKLPDASESQRYEIGLRDASDASSRPSRDFEWSAAVAGFALLLRDSPYKGQVSFDLVTELAQGSKGADKDGYRAEFLDLVQKARALRGQ
jgi:Ca-activated chloride channel family protein